MNYQQYFLPYSKKIDRLLNQFFTSEIKQSSKITSIGADMWQKLKEFIADSSQGRFCVNTQ